MPNAASSDRLFWPTIGFSIVVLLTFLVTQTLAVVAVLTLQLLQTPQPVDRLTATVASNGWLLSIATLISAPICTAMIGWFIQRRGRSIRDDLALSRPALAQLLCWVLWTAALIGGVELLHRLLNRSDTSSFMREVYQTAGNLPLLIGAIVVAAPVFEEVFFRGFLFRGLHSRLGAVGAIALPALGWALIHVQYAWYDMLYIFVFGLLLGVARLKTRSLYVPIAMHAFNNLLALLQMILLR